MTRRGQRRDAQALKRIRFTLVGPKRVRFTLVELLVVVTIIAILASMLLPALADAKKRAMGVACKSQLHQFYIALASYAGDFEDHYPAVFQSNQMYFAAKDFAMTDPWTIYKTAWRGLDMLDRVWLPGANANSAAAGEPAGYLDHESFVVLRTCPFRRQLAPADGTMGSWGYCYGGNSWWPGVYPSVGGDNSQGRMADRITDDPGMYVLWDLVTVTTASPWYIYNSHYYPDIADGANVVYNEGSVAWVRTEDMDPIQGNVFRMPRRR